MEGTDSYPLMLILGAGGFGALLGWYLYFINRYRTDEIKLEDLVTLVGVVGGGAVLALFPAKTNLFGAYGIGLFVGFFGYFATLLIMVALSNGDFTVGWFLDGRCKKLKVDFERPGGQHPSVRPVDVKATAVTPTPTKTPIQHPMAIGRKDDDVKKKDKDVKRKTS